MPASRSARPRSSTCSPTPPTWRWSPGSTARPGAIVRPRGRLRRAAAVDPTEDLSTSSDAVLVVAISRYRQEALAEAYRRHAGAVYALARRLLIDAALAEEIVQEVFLRLWNAPDR